MPTAGKSTLAGNLSHHLGLPWLSTDHVGIVMRSVASRDGHPHLFTWDAYGSDPSAGELSAAAIADNEWKNSEANWIGVRKLIVEDYTWTDGFVIEGAGILPHLVAEDFAGSDVVRAVFVGDRDTDRIRRTMAERESLWSEEKEVEWVLRFDERLRAEAERFRFPWVDLEKNDQDLMKVIGALGYTTMAPGAPRPGTLAAWRRSRNPSGSGATR